MGDELYKLEVLSLVSKITQEILNHTGINEKTLAEFVIALHEQSKTKDEFKSKLHQNGAEFSDSVIDNVDRLILSMHPKYKKKSSSGKGKGKSKVDNGVALTEKEKTARMFPGLALPDQEWQPPVKGNADKDATVLEVDNLMSQLEGVGKRTRPSASDFITDDPAPRKRRRDDEVSPPRRRQSPPRRDEGNGYGRRGDDRRGRQDYGRPSLDEKPVLFKIYSGKVSGMRDFGAFVTLEGVVGRAEGMFCFGIQHFTPFNRVMSSGMVHISNIQQGARVNNAADLLTRGQAVKVKVMSVAGTRLGLSIKDVDQATGKDLTPHLRIKSEAEMIEEEKLHASRASSTNAIPLGGGATESRTRSVKRLTSPERWEIKQMISSGHADAADYPELHEEFDSPMARAEVDEELDVEVREDEPAFLAGQTKQSLALSPVKIVKAPDGSLNRAALAGASLAKERRELRQQEVNDEADSQARDFNTPWLDPMSQEGDRVFAQDARGNILGQKAGEVPKWREETFNKATTFGKITSLSITEQRQSLPIYKLRGPLLEAIGEVSFKINIQNYPLTCIVLSTKF